MDFWGDVSQMHKDQQNGMPTERRERRLGARSLSRREALRRVGEVMVAAPFVQAHAKAKPVTGSERLSAAPSGSEPASGKIPFSFIIDDGSPVDPLFYEH